jgi:hypothetical protein
MLKRVAIQVKNDSISGKRAQPSVIRQEIYTMALT